MWNYFLAALMLLVSLPAAAGGTKLVWLEETYDFGAFNEDLGLVYCTFKAVNVGDEPAIVMNARANCGCTTPTYPKTPIAPGDTLSISVAYDAKGRPGRFEKFIYVNTNTTPSRTKLRIIGTVIGASNTLKGRYPIESGPIRIDNRVVPFGEVMKGHSGGAYVKGYNHTSQPVRPRVTDLPDYMQAIVQPATVPPGEQFVVSLTALTDHNDIWGLVTDSITLIPDSLSTERLSLSTVVIVKEDFSKLTPQQLAKAPVVTVSPDKLDFGRIDTSSTAALSQTFKITNTGSDPLIIHRIYSADKAVSVKISATTIKKGKSATVTVTVRPEELRDSRMLNAIVNIISNSPEMSSVRVRVVGETF